MNPIRLAAELPDIPRWVETRGMLLSGGATVTGGASVAEGFVVRVLQGALSAMSVVGTPPAPAIVEAVAQTTEMTPIVCQLQNADFVYRCVTDARAAGREWRVERAIVHLLSGTTAGARRIAAPPHVAGAPLAADVRLLSAQDSLEHLPPGLRYEMANARLFAPVGTVFIGGVAASFCYPVWSTDTLGDVSIDTLEAYRGRGIAAVAVDFMVDLMSRRGQQPVWGALASNTSSLRLAAKLGFHPVDEIAVVSRGPWAFLTAGYEG